GEGRQLMCGIAGYIGSRELPEERIRATLDLMRRRGPDHAAFRRFVTPAGKHVALLHSRLSIIDLDERSNQPLEADGSWLVFNGELYNYVEMRAELERLGAAFRTTSDTEVMARALRQFGTRTALDKAEGMWA